MAKTIKGRVQHPVYTAAALKAKNPVLLEGEIVYESDTTLHKVGDGVTPWNALAYARGGGFEGGIPAEQINQDATHRFVTDVEKSAWNAKADRTTASADDAGLMSAADKQKLDGAVIGADIVAAAIALAAGKTPTVSWDPATNKFTFGIPKGDKGDSGSEWLMKGDFSLIAEADRSFTLSNYAQRSGDKLWIEFAYLGGDADGHMIGFSQGQSIIFDPAETLNTKFYSLVTSGGSAKQYTVSFRFRMVGLVLYIYATNERTDGRDIVGQFRIKGVRVLRK